jgi:hypothetical protein
LWPGYVEPRHTAPHGNGTCITTGGAGALVVTAAWLDADSPGSCELHAAAVIVIITANVRIVFMATAKSTRRAPRAKAIFAAFHRTAAAC